MKFKVLKEYVIKDFPSMGRNKKAFDSLCRLLTSNAKDVNTSKDNIINTILNGFIKGYTEYAPYKDLIRVNLLSSFEDAKNYNGSENDYPKYFDNLATIFQFDTTILPNQGKVFWILNTFKNVPQKAKNSKDWQKQIFKTRDNYAMADDAFKYVYSAYTLAYDNDKGSGETPDRYISSDGKFVDRKTAVQIYNQYHNDSEENRNAKANSIALRKILDRFDIDYGANDNNTVLARKVFSNVYGVYGDSIPGLSANGKGIEPNNRINLNNLLNSDIYKTAKHIMDLQDSKDLQKYLGIQNKFNRPKSRK